MGFDNIYIREQLQTTTEELEAEMARAVADFKRVGQDYDEGKLREQAFETLKVLPPPLYSHIHSHERRTVTGMSVGATCHSDKNHMRL